MHEIFNHRSLLTDLVKRDLRTRYLGSMLGRYWNLIHPITLICLYTFVFAHILGTKVGVQETRSEVPYAVFLCCGLLPWNFFAESILRGTSSMVENAHFIRKIRFPIGILPGISLGAAFFNLLVSYLLFLIVAFFLGVRVSPVGFLCLTFTMVLQTCFQFGLMSILSCLNVFLRDIQQLVSIGVQLLFWLTPVVYPVSKVPPAAAYLLQANPMYYFVEAYHQAVLLGGFQQMTLPCIMLLLTVASLLAGSFVFSMARPTIPDEL